MCDANVKCANFMLPRTFAVICLTISNAQLSLLRSCDYWKSALETDGERCDKA